MKARDAQKLRDILLIVGFMIMLASYFCEPLLVIGIVVGLSGIIPDFLYNKCPHCGARLGKNTGRFCQHCGGKID